MLAASQHDLSNIALFDAAGQPLTWWREPVDTPLARPEQIKLTLAGDNGVLAAIVKTRNTAASSWHRAYQGVFYRLQGSVGVLRNPPRPP